MEDNKHTSVNGKIVPFLQAQCDFSKDIMSEKFQHKVVHTNWKPSHIVSSNVFWSLQETATKVS